MKTAGRRTFTVSMLSEPPLIMSLKDVKRLRRDSTNLASPLFSYSLRGANTHGLYGVPLGSAALTLSPRDVGFAAATIRARAKWSWYRCRCRNPWAAFTQHRRTTLYNTQAGSQGAYRNRKTLHVIVDSSSAINM